MVSKVSEGIEISVETFYQPDYSNPLQSEFMFAYRISIENKNSFPVKLHRRHWQIFDSNGQNREVDGEGVVGVQPTLNPGEKYQYVSGCNLRTEMGRMIGVYQMENLITKKIFEVAIPSFEMVVPFKNNWIICSLLTTAVTEFSRSGKWGFYLFYFFALRQLLF